MKISKLNQIVTRLGLLSVISLYVTDNISASTLQIGSSGLVILPQTGVTPNAKSLVNYGSDSILTVGVPWAYSSATLTPLKRFTMGTGSETGCITDNLTGLMWVSDPGMVKLIGNTSVSTSYPNAVNSINTVNKNSGICGHNDWHIPSVNEGRSLMNYSFSSPGAWLTQNGFKGLTNTYFWTSTVKVANSSEPGGPGYYNWTINTWSGGTHFSNSSTNGSSILLPVRNAATLATTMIARVPQTSAIDSYGVTWPKNRFVKDTTGACMVDTLTGLVWLRDMNKLPTSLDGASRLYNWTSAVTVASQMNSDTGVCGYNDWRLPNINELGSLFNANYGNMGTWLDSQGFKTIAPGYFYNYYWTSTVFASDYYYAWGMDSRGKLDTYHTGSLMYVLPVRGGYCNSNNCNNLPPENAPIVSVPAVTRQVVPNIPLTIYDGIPGDLVCAYELTSLNVFKERFDSVGETSVIDVMSQSNAQKAANKAQPITWDFISGAYKNQSVYGSAYCAYNYKSYEAPRSNLVVYRSGDNITFQARTYVVAAHGLAAQITCNTATNLTETLALEGNHSVTCKIGGSNTVPYIELNAFAANVK